MRWSPSFVLSRRTHTPTTLEPGSALYPHTEDSSRPLESGSPACCISSRRNRNSSLVSGTGPAPATAQVPGIVVALIGNRAITELYAHACALHVHTSLHGSAADWFTAKRDNLSARSGHRSIMTPRENQLAPMPPGNSGRAPELPAALAHGPPLAI